MGQVGDYAPPQATQRYTPQNPTSVYPLDAYSNATMYLPTEGNCFCGKKGYFPCQETKYPEEYIPGNYFSPDVDYPNMGKVPGIQRFNFYRQGTQPDFHVPQRENYGGRDNADGTFSYHRLPTAPGPRLNNRHVLPFHQLR